MAGMTENGAEMPGEQVTMGRPKRSQQHFDLDVGQHDSRASDRRGDFWMRVGFTRG